MVPQQCLSRECDEHGLRQNGSGEENVLINSATALYSQYFSKSMAYLA